MAEFKQGQRVLVRVDNLQPGPFDERLVVIKSEPANLSGFVDARFIEKRNSHDFLPGRIVEVTPNTVSLRLPGSFFTSAAGMASVSRDWAELNVVED